MSADRVAALRAGLLFCSADRRPAIQAMIDRLLAEQEIHYGDTEGTEGSARAGMTGSSPGDVNTHDEPVKPPCPPCLRSELDWRQRQLALRQAGHEVKQHDGVVRVDSRISGDPALYPPGMPVPV